MRVLEKGSCNADEKQVVFTATVMGNKIKACVSTKKQPVILLNKSYAPIHGCVVQPYRKSPASELEIFDEYNRFGKDKGETTFIEYPDNNGDMKVGFGTGGLLGGIDKEITLKTVDEATFNRIGELVKEWDEIEDIRNEHNFLYGDSNKEMMGLALNRENELKREWEELTGWRC